MIKLANVELLLRRIVELDETYQHGSAHVYLGVLAMVVPPSMGGRPEESRYHFERAIELSSGKNLMSKVVFAERYARQVFDRPLYDRLLREVLDASPDEPGFTLINTVAQAKARELLAEGNDFF